MLLIYYLFIGRLPQVRRLNTYMWMFRNKARQYHCSQRIRSELSWQYKGGKPTKLTEPNKLN